MERVIEDSYTALHYAARGDYVEVAKLLIANGVDVNPTGSDRVSLALCLRIW